MTTAKSLLAQATKLENQALELRNRARPLLGEAMIQLLNEGSWKIRNETLFAADHQTRKDAHKLAKSLGAIGFHSGFDFYIAEHNINGNIDDGTVSFTIFEVEKLGKLNIVNSNRFFAEKLEELRKRNTQIHKNLNMNYHAQQTIQNMMSLPSQEPEELVKQGWRVHQIGQDLYLKNSSENLQIAVNEELFNQVKEIRPPVKRW